MVTEDGLSANAPHIETLHDYGCHDILGVKEGDHAYLFKQVQAVAQKSPCACNLQHRPPLTQLIKLSLSLFKGSALHAESLAMLSKALPFLR